MATNTSEREESDLLMAWVSFNLLPVAPDRNSRSEPAKSTRWRVPFN
jgi:hypothetical protein